MKKDHKELLDEMIKLKNFEETNNSLFRKAIKSIPADDLNFMLGDILAWIKLNKTSVENSYKLKQSGHFNYTLLTKFCDQFNDLWVIKDDMLAWNSDLTAFEILEIKEYVDDSYKMLLRVRFGKD